MATRIYIGGLNEKTTEDALKAHFEQHGTVESVAINKGSAKDSLITGSIEMNSAEEAQKAITALNTKELGGRRLTVNQAKPKGGYRR